MCFYFLEEDRITKRREQPKRFGLLLRSANQMGLRAFVCWRVSLGVHGLKSKRTRPIWGISAHAHVELGRAVIWLSRTQL